MNVCSATVPYMSGTRLKLTGSAEFLPKMCEIKCAPNELKIDTWHLYRLLKTFPMSVLHKNRSIHVIQQTEHYIVNASLCTEYCISRVMSLQSNFCKKISNPDQITWTTSLSNFRTKLILSVNWQIIVDVHHSLGELAVLIALLLVNRFINSIIRY